MANIQIWYADGNDMVIEVADLINALTSAPINNATVQATLKDDQDVDVAGVAWPVIVPYAGSDGLYQVTIDKAAEVLDDVGYVLYIEANAPGGIDAEWRIQVGGETRS